MDNRKFRLKSNYSRLLADIATPVSIYLKLRDKYANSILLESSDYHAADNSFSYICCNPIAGFSLKKGLVSMYFPDGSERSIRLKARKDVISLLSEFIQSFEPVKYNFNFIDNGLFGYIGYDAVEYFEDINLMSESKPGYDIPEIQYTIYRNVIAINHFKSELHLFDHQWIEDQKPNNIVEITTIIESMNFPN